ncbi:DUF2141 domain-containing protein [Winogradskyella psychrotolerans]|uniref:DUF2141 domain-containing protein n=1 Tax=Winogradskyella psychrotolerans TaxID=1344585 RepID=UPI001C06B297|nr:DUF2141 domain-containing protein [Winogradskyella psychrotolerans]MBU2920858.1 DUF2141 domain-containing protein [Winogradskyella psychrotolerans]
MNILVKIIVILLLNVLSYQLQAQDNYSVTVTVTNANNDKGKIFVALYNTETGFLKENYKSHISVIENKRCTVTFEGIPEGVYAVSVFHDENDNGKMDTNFMHIPKEDYGCSNGATGFMGPPKWKDAKFELKANKTIKIKL